jgi:hypothetical protein
LCSLNRLHFLELEESIDGLLPAVQNAPEFSTPAIANTDDVAKRNSFTLDFGRDGPAEEAVVIEHANFRHIARIVSVSSRLLPRRLQVSGTDKVARDRAAVVIDHGGEPGSAR